MYNPWLQEKRTGKASGSPVSTHGEPAALHMTEAEPWQEEKKPGLSLIVCVDSRMEKYITAISLPHIISEAGILSVKS